MDGVAANEWILYAGMANRTHIFVCSCQKTNATRSHLLAKPLVVHAEISLKSTILGKEVHKYRKCLRHEDDVSLIPVCSEYEPCSISF